MQRFAGCLIASVLLAASIAGFAQKIAVNPLAPIRAVPSVVATDIPRYDHVVIVIMENTSDSTIIGNTAQAPYINTLAMMGAVFSDSHAITHPSEPNYLALFSGSTQGLSDDSCPHTFTGLNLGSQLIAAGFTFQGFSESMPSNGYTICTSGTYARKHNPWVNFSSGTNSVPSTSNLTFAAFPSGATPDFSTLPTLSFVVPNLCNDMHDCSIATGDAWLHTHIDPYLQWARSHNSLLILTWDEDDSTTSANQIPTMFVGAHVRNATFSEHIDHYSVLRTLEDMFGLSAIGGAVNATPITDTWNIFADGFE
ncbi:acid phosphatase [Pseudolysobacter antarcticus]|uniref:Acid phosphatase n=1 Tax=Pseudolysobacter antarcticus TaxID=2511995 RepID=A0A411HKF9_9GAMM|nr:alkaline phosphatase family protein [Pseudolysobacter antarcticus]QBB70978.1 acid phosphatase [Pseudolysobacter antarcticus]